jgi:SAM-dependent methyltransferase
MPKPGLGPRAVRGPALPAPHSAAQFGPQRDFWWNRDFLDLMAARWSLRNASSLADIGCGQCHWSRLLYPYLRAPARFAGVDREARWLVEAARKFHHAFPGLPPDRVTFVCGDASQIPLPSDFFDVVTCQTLLMHLAWPADALREMLRILRPGGLLVCVEPNNLWNCLPFTSLTAAVPVEVLVRRFEFWLRYHRGKAASGEGDHTIGDLLPGLFAQAGLTDIAVHLSDRAPSLFPPYETRAQQALVEQGRRWRDAAACPWDPADLRRHVLGGGGTEELFVRAFEELIEEFNREQQAIDAMTFHAALGGITYLVSGRKP